LAAGQSGKVAFISASGLLRQRFLDMGLLPGVEITVLRRAPLGDPMAVQVRGYTLALRASEGALIEVK
jgi:ferrous iron transport protein B